MHANKLEYDELRNVPRLRGKTAEKKFQASSIRSDIAQSPRRRWRGKLGVEDVSTRIPHDTDTIVKVESTALNSVGWKFRGGVADTRVQHCVRIIAGIASKIPDNISFDIAARLLHRCTTSPRSVPTPRPGRLQVGVAGKPAVAIGGAGTVLRFAPGLIATANRADLVKAYDATRVFDRALCHRRRGDPGRPALGLLTRGGTLISALDGPTAGGEGRRGGSAERMCSECVS
ncbi:uncharacterized protein BXZ73DRAFT_100934 [Epithele typhae]|uniref:uncharacterized protein n=1 Tax=Epithele typhae TaxID=378194 RepID=UPI002007BBD2|nr:uncharacterized protein BXZ73DRAFT_100934 [Epithele typhae]KAH9933549.1 hypothetical protein BXZ73DRAFT_100934 [Epithele typhae]